MAAPTSIDAIEWLRKQIEESAPDPLRAILVEMVNLLMSTEMDAVCNAGYRERSGERSNRRNGYRERAWDTRVFTSDADMPFAAGATPVPALVVMAMRALDTGADRDVQRRQLGGAVPEWVMEWIATCAASSSMR